MVKSWWPFKTEEWTHPRTRAWVQRWLWIKAATIVKVAENIMNNYSQLPR